MIADDRSSGGVCGGQKNLQLLLNSIGIIEKSIGIKQNEFQQNSGGGGGGTSTFPGQETFFVVFFIPFQEQQSQLNETVKLHPWIP
jgi:hypothetical protein